jgi:Fe-S oxidoreductase
MARRKHYTILNALGPDGFRPDSIHLMMTLISFCARRAWRRSGGKYVEFGKKEARRCVHGEPAFCTAACPFGLDVRDFATRLGRGRTDAAYRIFRDAVGFPFIVAALCPAPCQQVCVRCKTDDAVQLHALEQAVCAHARNTKPTRYNVPKKQGRTAIIGAGPSALACALRLGMMNYDVTLYEKSGRIGGHLNGLVAQDILDKDFQTQLQAVDYTLKLNTNIDSLDALDADAVYVATGAGGEDFGLLTRKDGGLVPGAENVLLGGSMTGVDSINALAHGLLAAQALDVFFKTGRLEAPTQACTALCVDEGVLSPTPKVVAAGEVYTKEEMTAETARCIKCDCDICQKTCDLMGYYEKYPKRIVDEVEITVYPSVMFGHRVATRLIASCTQCGVCRETCPKAIDMQTFLLESRREMERMGDMPKAWSAFWLEDMAHANGERAALTVLPQGLTKVSRAFFPGCQLGASDPRYVEKTYQALLAFAPDTGLIIGCCGAPAYWAGREDLFEGQALERLRETWRTMGEPELLLACPTCKKLMAQFLPEIKTSFVYAKLNGVNAAGEGVEVGVFDPCSSRHESGVHEDVRGLLHQSGYRTLPLENERENALCCGYGGQTMIANPRFAQHVTDKRLAQSPLPYVTYCTNCRDTFAAKRKRAMHVLDAVFALDDGTRRPPTWTKRRENREMLKRNLGKEAATMAEPIVKVSMTDAAAEKMQRDYILREDIERVIEHCERTGRKLIDAQTGRCIGHLAIGHMTFWVEYAQDEGGFMLFDCYAHRMRIQEDAPCNAN